MNDTSKMQYKKTQESPTLTAALKKYVIDRERLFKDRFGTGMKKIFSRPLTMF